MMKDGSSTGWRILLPALGVVLLFSCSGGGGSGSGGALEIESVTLAEDGIFTMSPSGSYPAYRYRGDRDRTYFGYYSSDNCIYVAYWDHSEDAAGGASMLWSGWGLTSDGDMLGDDHANPSIIVLEHQAGDLAVHNGKLLVAAAEHGWKLEVRRSRHPEDIVSWEDPVPLRETKATYARLVELADGRVWLLCRLTRYTSNSRAAFYIWESGDAGATWGEPQLLVDSEEGTEDAVYIALNGNASGTEVHFAVNRMVYDSPAPGVWIHRDIYYIRYDAVRDEWRTADGRVVARPMTFGDLDVVYRSDDTPGLEDWTYVSDIKVDAGGNPFLVSVNEPDRGTLAGDAPGIRSYAMYHYFREGTWRTETVYETSRFGPYPAMATLSGKDPGVVFAGSPGADGSGRDLAAYRRSPGGGDWSRYATIRSTGAAGGCSARPFYALNAGDEPMLFWSYITHYEGSPYVNWVSGIRACTIP